jgi:signal transduction histidine kinase
VAAVTAWRVWVDVMLTPKRDSFWRSFLEPAAGSVPWYVAVLLALVLVGGFGGIGLWLRTRSELASANRVVAAERHHVTTLTDQVSRQAERERLAREIHDGLGHNLSILSVHAGALEAMAQRSELAEDGAPPAERAAAAQLRESARVVRETAARSVAELHGLLDLLRNPDDADLAAPTRTLRDVRSLIDESVTAGMPLIATVYVDDSQAIDPHVAQAAYRIVQELLTNARKHAATIPVRLTMSGSPGEGALMIGTANHLPPSGNGHHPPPETDDGRAGTGLSGIRERVERHGGDMAAGVDPHGVFRVSVRLPWSAPDPTRDARETM